MIKFTVFEAILVFHTTRASNIGSNFSSSQLQHRQASKQNSSSHHRQCGLPTRTTRSLSPARHEPPFGALCTTSPSSCLSSSFLADTHAHYFLQHRNIFQLECSPFISTTPSRSIRYPVRFGSFSCCVASFTTHPHSLLTTQSKYPPPADGVCVSVVT